MSRARARMELIKRSHWARFRLGLDILSKQTSCFLLDAVAVLYTIVMISYIFSRVAYGEEQFLLIPWWLILALVVETTLVWEAAGISVGMKLTRLRLLTPTDEPPTLVQRLLRLWLVHVVALPLLGHVMALWDRRQRTLCDALSGMSLRLRETPTATKTPWYRTSAGLSTALLVALTIVVASYVTEIRLVRLFTGASRAGIVVKGLVRPNWSVLGEGLGLLVETLFMSLIATLLGILVAVPLSFAAARNLTTGVLGRLVYTVVRVTMSITRSIEPMIWAVIFVLWVRLGTFPGMLALWVHSIADLTKLYAERLESIDQGPVEAMRAAGANKVQVILYGIVPQIVNPYLSFTLYRWDINVRMATIIGIVAGGGIGQQLFLYTRYWKWQSASTMMLLIMATVWLIDYISARLRARLEEGSSGRATGRSPRGAKVEG
jgi:phosphonate transport system permease protein